MKKFKYWLITALFITSSSEITSADEIIKYATTTKALTLELNAVSKELGWHKYTEEDVKILIIMGISELEALLNNNHDRERLLKLAKGISEDGKILIPIRLRQSLEDGLLLLPDTKKQIHVNTGKFTIVDLDILSTDKVVEGEKLDWHSIRVFIKAHSKINPRASQ